MKRAFLTIAFLASWALVVSAQTFTVVTANLQHGEGTDATTNYARQVTALAGADLIAVQERTTGDTGWNASLASAGLVEAVYRENDSNQGDGPAIWYKSSSVTVNAIYSTALQSTNLIGWDGSTTVNKSAVAAKVTISGKQFYFVSTHLCWSACADSSGSTQSVQREGQIATLLSWINSTLTGGLDVVIAGDMNFAPDYPKSTGGVIKSLFTVGYTDLWNTGLTLAKATAAWNDRDSNGSADMPVGDLTTRTHDTRRIDYIFLKNGPTHLNLKSIRVPDSRAVCPHGLVAGGALPSCSPEVTGGPGVSGNQWDIEDDYGVRPSDHNFVWAVFNFLPPTSYAVTTNRTPFTKPALTGALDLTVGGRGAGYTFTDPTFGTPITRCTDENFWPDQPGRNHMAPDTAEVRSWSIYSTKLYVMNIEGGVITPVYWQGTPKQCARMGDTSITSGGIWLSGTLTGGVALPSWSGQDDNIMWGTGGTSGFKLRKLDFSGITGASTTVPFTEPLDYQTVFTAIGGGTLTGSTCSLGVSGVDANTDYVVTAINGNQDDWNKVVWWNSSTGAYKVLDTATNPLRWWDSATSSWTNITGSGGGWTMHNVKLSKDGRHVMVTVDNNDGAALPSGAGFLAVWDTTANTFFYTSTGLDGGHRSAGVGYMINQDANGSDSSQWNLRALTNATTFNTATKLVVPSLSDPSSVPQYTAMNPDFDEHSSWETARFVALFPAFSLTSRNVAVDGSHPWRPYDDEAVALRTDVPGTVWRLFHHHSARIIPTPTPYDYYGYSFGQISADGLYAIFSSNWEFTLTYPTGNDPNTELSCAPSCKRIDTFIASLPTGGSLPVSSRGLNGKVTLKGKATIR